MPPNKGACAPNDDLLKNVEEGNPGLWRSLDAASGDKIALQVADACGGKIVAIPTRNQIDLVVEVEDAIVDGGSREQNEFLACLAELAIAFVGGKDAFKILVALRVAVAEIVAFIDQKHVGTLHVTHIVALASQHLLRHDGRGNASTAQFIMPHFLQGGGTDHHSMIAFVIGVIL